MSTTQPTRALAPDSPIAAQRGRIPVSECWFTDPLPKLSQGAAYIGSGTGWTGFKLLADLQERTMIVSLPDKRVLRVPFENIKCYICG